MRTHTLPETTTDEGSNLGARTKCTDDDGSNYDDRTISTTNTPRPPYEGSNYDVGLSLLISICSYTQIMDLNGTPG